MIKVKKHNFKIAKKSIKYLYSLKNFVNFSRETKPKIEIFCEFFNQVYKVTSLL